MANPKVGKSGNGKMPQAPDRGDLIWVDFTPHLGHEQAGRRPALVLTPRAYNAKSGLLVCCPITSQSKGYPFELALPANLPATGIILVDQIRSLDWTVRLIKKIGKVPRETLENAWDLVSALLGEPPPSSH